MIFSLQDGKHFYQWDRERVLMVLNDEVNQVHFTNDTVTFAIVKDVYTSGGARIVDVPSVLLQCSCNLTAYAFVVEGENREYTLLHEEFKILARKRPDDYIPPEEHDKWVEVRKEILEALEQSKTAAAAAASDKEHAETSAQNAKESETKAVQSASEAAEYAESIKSSVEAAEKSASDAKLSAESAAASASAAGNYATAAGASENNASASESNAKSYMESAGQSATSASASKEAAKTSETNAAASASSAAISKTSAENSAKAAKTSETNAASSASTAAEKATEAAASAASSKASEESASESANTATAKALEAAASATVSAENKAAAALSEQNAATSAENASASATAAGNSASAAEASANTANSAASTATTKANAAASSASAAAASESAAKTAQTAAEDAKAKAEAARDQAQEIAGGDYVTKKELESKGYLTEHQDISGKADVSDLTAHTRNSTIHVTAAEKTAWNEKSDFSGSYNDLTNKPKIPTVPTKISEFTNDAGYLTEETDPTVPGWAKQSQKPTYTASEVGADSSGTAAGAVSGHNTDADSHSDIRLLIETLNTRLNTLANSEDVDLDQMAEIVAYIKANRGLIESVTTSKVSISDIVDNLTTNVSNKPLSAAQGVVLKALIDAITVPTKVSELENDKGYLTQHQDISGKANVSDLTAHTGNSTIHVTSQEKASWNAKSDFSGNYNDLTNVPTKVSVFTNDAGYLTEHQDISAKANKPTESVITLSAAGWSSGVYSLESTYQSETYDVEIRLSSTATAEQGEAFDSAMMIGVDGTNTIKCRGAVPTVDIPVVARVVKK